MRPTFYLDDNVNKPIRAGGVIIYKFINNIMYVLLIERNGLYEDIGGCTEESDKTHIDTVVREVYEESNKLIKRKNTRNKLKKAYSYYIPNSKYIIYFIEATIRQQNMTSNDFGNYELHDNIERTINWIPLSHFLNKTIAKYKHNNRIKHTHIYQKLRQIRNTKILRQSILKIINKTNISNNNIINNETNINKTILSIGL